MMFERRGRRAPHQVGEDLGGVFGLCEALRAPAHLGGGDWRPPAWQARQRAWMATETTARARCGSTMATRRGV